MLDLSDKSMIWPNGLELGKPKTLIRASKSARSLPETVKASWESRHQYDCLDNQV